MEKKIGFLGLGSMGLNMVYRLLDQGYEVHGWNRSEGPRREAEKAGAVVYASIPDLVAELKMERKVVWSMVAAGEPVDRVIEQATGDSDEHRRLTAGDIFVDGANSHYKETVRRGEMLAGNEIQMIDCGVSGGISGARNGACIMVGGLKEVYEYVEPLISDLATDNGYGYFGDMGAGHYVKMVHNAIEYSMMQAIGEGVNLIKHSDYDVNFSKLVNVWNHGSIIAGNLMGFLGSALKKDPGLERAPVEIGSLGTGKWAVAESLERAVPFSGIAYAIYNRYASRDQESMINKVVSALRAEFGGHNETERPLDYKVSS